MPPFPTCGQVIDIGGGVTGPSWTVLKCGNTSFQYAFSTLFLRLLELAMRAVDIFSDKSFLITLQFP